MRGREQVLGALRAVVVAPHRNVVAVPQRACRNTRGSRCVRSLGLMAGRKCFSSNGRDSQRVTLLAPEQHHRECEPAAPVAQLQAQPGLAEERRVVDDFEVAAGALQCPARLRRQGAALQHPGIYVWRLGRLHARAKSTAGLTLRA